MLIVSFQGHTPNSPVPNPGRHADFVSVQVRDANNKLIQPLRIRDDGGLTGLSLGWSAQIDLDSSVTGFELVLGCFATLGEVEVFDSKGQLLQQVPVVPDDNHVGRASYSHNDIRRLFIRSPNNETNLLLLTLDGLVESTATRQGLFDESIIVLDGLSDVACAEVIFGETATLRAPNAEKQLATGRTFIAAVAYDRYIKDPTRFAPRKHPTPKELEDASISKHWDLCEKAAKDGRDVSIGNCRHFVIWPIDQSGKAPTKAPKIPDNWPYDEASKITERYGPFKNYGELKGDNFHIFKYCGVS